MQLQDSRELLLLLLKKKILFYCQSSYNSFYNYKLTMKLRFSNLKLIEYRVYSALRFRGTAAAV